MEQLFAALMSSFMSDPNKDLNDLGSVKNIWDQFKTPQTQPMPQEPGSETTMATLPSRPAPNPYASLMSYSIQPVVEMPQVSMPNYGNVTGGNLGFSNNLARQAFGRYYGN